MRTQKTDAPSLSLLPFFFFVLQPFWNRELKT